jgi:PAS domain S-box-containing protein
VEEELDKHRQHLEELVKERTAKLTQANTQLKKEVAERKQLEENLLKEKSFSETVINSLPGIFYLVDEQLTILRYNKNAETVTGYSDEEISKLTAFDFISEEDRGNAAEKMRETLEKIEGTMEVNLLTKDGEKIPYFFTGRHLNVDNEKYILGMGIDITERKRAEEKLKNTNAFLASLVESPADVIILSVDRDYNYTFFNAAHAKEMKKVWGVDIEIGKNLLNYIPNTEERAGVRENFERILTGVQFKKEEVYGKPENRFWYELAYNPIFDEINDVIGITIFITDITERKRAEIQQQLQSEIAVNMSEGVNLVRVNDGIIIYTNPGFEKIFGYGPGEMVGKHISIVNAPTDKSPEKTSKEIFESLNRNRYWYGEIENIKKDGTTFWCHASVSVFDHTEHGKVYVSVNQDITEQKRMQEELKIRQKEIEEINTNLEKRVQEELEKSRQKDFIMMHQARLAAMGEMIGHIAHQWKQPLNALNILMFNIKDGLDDPELNKEMLYTLIPTGKKLIEKMSKTIDDFRSFFKPDKQKEKFSINKNIKDALSIVSADFKYHNISVSMNEGEEITILGFSNEYSQVVLNIINNAIDAIIAKEINGEIKIDLFCENDSAVVEINDNAGGIPEEIINYIFDPYFSTKEENKGTGIGLYMSKLIIEDHMGGRIDVQNIDDGAKFRIIIPMIQS